MDTCHPAPVLWRGFNTLEGNWPQSEVTATPNPLITTRIITITIHSLQHRESGRAFAICLETNVTPQLYYGYYCWLWERYFFSAGINSIHMTFMRSICVDHFITARAGGALFSSKALCHPPNDEATASDHAQHSPIKYTQRKPLAVNHFNWPSLSYPTKRIISDCQAAGL